MLFLSCPFTKFSHLDLLSFFTVKTNLFFFVFSSFFFFLLFSSLIRDGFRIIEACIMEKLEEWRCTPSRKVFLVSSLSSLSLSCAHYVFHGRDLAKKSLLFSFYPLHFSLSYYLNSSVVTFLIVQYSSFSFFNHFLHSLTFFSFFSFFEANTKSLWFCWAPSPP